jgi:ribosome-binding protein aMBF1 (putative translation factor)
MNLSDMVPLDAVIAEQRQDPAFRQAWDEGVFARQVAITLVRYRAERGLTQQQLADLLEVHQPNVARLESGEKTPTLKELARMTAVTGLTFHLSVANGAVELSEAA